MTARIDKVVTSGTFELDGGSWEVDNNVWLVGDEREVLVIDAAHDAAAIAQAVGERRVVAVVCTHAHDDHVRFALIENQDRSRQALRGIKAMFRADGLLPGKPTKAE